MSAGQTIQSFPPTSHACIVLTEILCILLPLVTHTGATRMMSKPLGLPSVCLNIMPGPLSIVVSRIKILLVPFFHLQTVC